MIDVERLGENDPLKFKVTVTEGTGTTEHQVTMSLPVYRKLTGGSVTAEQCIQAAFRFLLDHEPKESILSRFDVTVISKYFPGFERDLAKYLPKPGRGS